MSDIIINELDHLYKNYGYELDKISDNKLRVYTLRYGMYFAAEIVKLDSSAKFKKIKREYSDVGYATELREFKNIEEAEKALFNGFFINAPLVNKIKNKYRQFVNKQISNLPDGSSYQYIDSPYEFSLFDTEGNLANHKSTINDDGHNIISRIKKVLREIKGPIFIIIEAAAGFGKTCSAYEILNEIIEDFENQLPLFTELSRNREARVFKHILNNEVDQQFPNGIKSEVVINQIKTGGVPLIIDGFDELITKDMTFNSSEFNNVESMLSTIVDLLEGDSRIIITSRKTAIFKSEEFYNWATSRSNKFSIARFEIKPPTIPNWLEYERFKLIDKTDFPVEQISNPVLLSFLRNISFDKFKEYFSGDHFESIVDEYLEFLLTREQDRQNLKIDNETQLRIFRKLVRFFTELEVNSEKKEFIKDLIKDYNRRILIACQSQYTPQEKPSIDDLSETLSNHVFLDRKDNGNIGFVNDFIFGLLIGENLINGKFKSYYPEFYKIIPMSFSIFAVTSFKVQSKEKQEKLWEIFTNNPFNYDINFYFIIDLLFKQRISSDYQNLEIRERNIKNIDFDNSHSISSSVFTDVTFYNCSFDLSSFKACVFITCNFYKCTITNNINDAFKNNLQLLGCNCDNDFIKKVNINEKKELKAKHVISDTDILELFFNVDRQTSRHRELTSLKDKFDDFDINEVNQVIDKLQKHNYLVLDGKIGHITKEGIAYFHKSEAS